MCVFEHIVLELWMLRWLSSCCSGKIGTWHEWTLVFFFKVLSLKGINNNFLKGVVVRELASFQVWESKDDFVEITSVSRMVTRWNWIYFFWAALRGAFHHGQVHVFGDFRAFRDLSPLVSLQNTLHSAGSLSSTPASAFSQPLRRAFQPTQNV